MSLCMAAKKSRKRKSASAAWERPAPGRSRHTKLTSREKSGTKSRAKKAGRRYPNLVDNIFGAKRKGGARRALLKNPEAGLKRSWAFVVENGKSVRFALSPRALRERTIAAARRIAAKGRRLWDRYRLQLA
jgi:hypothetical protein